MNSGLKEYKYPSVYGVSVVKRRKPQADDDNFVPSDFCTTTGYYTVRQKPQSSQRITTAPCVFPQATPQTENKLIGLGGSRYEEIARLVTRGEATTIFHESIDDGRIDFDRIVIRIGRKQVSCKPSDAYEIVLNAFDGHESIRPAKTPEARTVIFSVVGTLAGRSNDEWIVDWYGGGKLFIPQSQAEGDWTELKIGDWLQATVARKTNGEVVRAMLLGPAEEPQSFSEEELRESYTSIPPANLAPVK